MIAGTQYEPSASDLGLLLALVRGRSLAAAGRLLGLDPSTVFRSVQRLEKALGQRLFERARSGYSPTELCLALATQGEVIETAVAAARSSLRGDAGQLAGTVRIGAVDAVLHAFILPALAGLRQRHPQLQLELQASSEPSNLSFRDVDIALRSTNQPPPHLLGKSLGNLGFAVFARPEWRAEAGDLSPAALAALPWIAVDQALPEHPGVRWRQRVLPQVRPALLANSMLTVAALLEQGLGVGVLALFHARQHPQLVALTPPLPECSIGLWLLTHPESRHLRRIAEVATAIEAEVRRPGALPA